MIINHNVSAIFAHRTLKFHDWSLTSDIEKLSSGLRINKAGDDASGLAVSEKMRSQIQGLRQAERHQPDREAALSGCADQARLVLRPYAERVRSLRQRPADALRRAVGAVRPAVEAVAELHEVEALAFHRGEDSTKLKPL